MVYVAKTAVRLRSRPDWCFTKCHSGPRPKKNCCRRLCMVKMKSLLQKGNFGHQTSTRTIEGAVRNCEWCYRERESCNPARVNDALVGVARFSLGKASLPVTDHVDPHS